MIVGVLADSHDNVPALKAALENLKAEGAQAVLHAGDIIAPFSAKVLASCGLVVYAVYGNNDGEKAGLAGLIDVTEPPRTVELGARSILLAHDADKVPEAERARADVLVVGHTHEASFALPLLNPGECGGWLNGKKTFALLDLDSLQARIVEF